ncbi:hypothetical protein [Pseudoflavitalea rhizosphaerae]|uniref:hypothetical protein n=1 Tax=Pseudoflavitalea rhizosphaerae TaxID=1884793 RepID=UPI000F8DE599|nr:hypothetical protein [Pseudoflavitalea rhizosphaerae]
MKRTTIVSARLCLLLLLATTTLHAQLSKYDESVYKGVFPVSGNAANMQGLAAVKTPAATKAIQEAGLVGLRSHLSGSLRWVKVGDSYALAVFIDAGLEQFSFKVPSADFGMMSTERWFSNAGIATGAWRISGIVLEITNSKGTFNKRVSFDLSGNWEKKGAGVNQGKKVYTTETLVSNKEAFEVYNLVNNHMQKKWDPSEPFFRYGYFKVTVINPGTMESNAYPVAALRQYAAAENKKASDKIALLKQGKEAAAKAQSSRAGTSTSSSSTANRSSTNAATAKTSGSSSTTGSARTSGSSSANRASSSASAANRRSVDAHNAQIRRQADAISRQSDQTWNAYQNVLKQTQDMFKVDEATRRKREAEAEEDEREWEAEQRRKRREEARREREREQAEAERRERQRLADEKARQEAAARDAKRKADYAIWVNNGKAAFDKAYKTWQQEDIKIVSELLGTYPKLTIDAIRDFNKLMAIPQLSTAEKSAIIKSVTHSINQYRSLHRQYNFYGEIPGYSSQTPRMQYRKALDGFDPRARTSHYDYISSRPETIPSKQVLTYNANFQKSWNMLKSAMGNKDYTHQLKDLPAKFNYAGNQYIPSWSYRSKRPSGFTIKQPYMGLALLPAHAAFLEEFTRQAYDLKHDPYRKEYDLLHFHLARHYYLNQEYPAAFHQLLTILSNNNIASLQAFLDLPVAKGESDYLFTESSSYNKFSNDQEIELTEKKRTLTGNAAFILYQNGYLDESAILFSQAMASFSREQTGSGYRVEKRETWKYPGESRQYAFWQYYSWLIKCQYQQGKKELVQEQGKLFLNKMKSAFHKTSDDILRAAFVGRNATDIRTDHHLYQSYLRAVAYYARALVDNGDKKGAEKLLKSTLKAYRSDKQFAAATTNRVMPDIEAALEVVFPGAITKKSQQALLPAPPEKDITGWTSRYDPQIQQIRQAFQAKKYDSVIAWSRKLRGTLHPSAITPAATPYIEIMTQAAFASLYTHRYQDGIAFASFGPAVDKALPDPEVARVLNALMLCKTNQPLYHYNITHKITDENQITRNRYYLEQSLIRYASTRFGSSSGYEKLEEVARELSERGISSPYLAHLFNAIGFGAKNLANR